MAWCRFQDEGEALCLLQAGALSAYTLAGELQSVSLPPSFTAMWALPQGLLLAVRALPTAILTCAPVLSGATARLASGPCARRRRACCWQPGWQGIPDAY